MRIPYNWLKEYIKTDLEPKEIAERLTMVGHALDKPIYEQEGDTIIDLEDRGNRADVSGILGIARDLTALTGVKLEYPKTSVIPLANNDNFQPKIEIQSEKVLRWRAVVFKNVKISPSPDFIQKRLKTYGIEVINNVVDITNYIMVEMGMPLHAFDLDKVSEIILRPAKRGETLVTFEGTELKFDEGDLLAADKTKPLTLTTAVGGRESGVSGETKNILIEAGLYDQPTARRSALRLNVRNETSQRLGKYLHPQYCDEAIARAVYLMKEILHVEPEPVSFDYYPKTQPTTIISLSNERVNNVAGSVIELEEIKKILESLEFKIIEESKSGIAVEVPYFRTDVTIEDDLVEEVLRIRGYDKIPSFLPNRPAPPKLIFPEMDLENKLRDVAVTLGYIETVSQPIVDLKTSEKTGLTDENKLVRLENSWNEELNVLRPEMLSSQLNYFCSYEKRGVGSIKIFEAGKIYSQDKSRTGYEKYMETRKFVMTAGADYLTFKADVEALLDEIGVKNYEFKKIDLIFKKQVGAGLVVGETEIAKLGEVKQSVLTAFGISQRACHAVFYVSKLLNFIESGHRPEISLKNENYISEDFTFKVALDKPVGELVSLFKKELNDGSRFSFVGVYIDDKLKNENKKNVTFNFKFEPTMANGESLKLKNLNFKCTKN